MLFCYSCSTSQQLYINDGTSISNYYALSGNQLKPLTLVSDGTGQTVLKADKIKIVNEGGEPYTLGGDRAPSLYSYRKIWGKYQWIGFDRNSENFFLQGHTLEIHPDLTYTISYYSKLNRVARKRYESRRRTQSHGRVIWVNRNTYLLNEYRGGQQTEGYFTVRHNARGIKFLGVNSERKEKNRGFGRRFRKLKE